ncbi:MAG: peptidoglycan DD-metalloendopeptidase family protein [Calditrichaceae bacterium]|nr:peptidoglycan DD-metalloendopeptidase family protein [Calditrichaceae bacterium]MBN2710091.1 peptidoglycan DD-metalloendopeptidase family protein [Calditrichaceae bacterium]RQV94260.1 MAG: M23 family peptidase [Calditrichota bacterium]
MKDESRLIFVSKNQQKIKEFKISRIKLFSSVTIFLLVVLAIGKFTLDYMVDFSVNNEMKRLERTNTVLESRLEEMKNKIQLLSGQINVITQKDDQLRTVLGLDAIDEDIRKVGIGGTRYDFDINDEVSGFNENISLSKQLTEVAKLEREINLELKSYQELLNTYNAKQDSMAYLPALRPVVKGVLSSDFGMRTHPILKYRRYHEGVDISAPRGTPVYATADGIVRFAGRNGGYGNVVYLNHHYGFETRYGHLNKFVVRNGQIVKRGEKIGEIGSTGLSNAPHLHYEVRYNGQPVDPKNYYFDDQILNERVVAGTMSSK